MLLGYKFPGMKLHTIHRTRGLATLLAKSSYLQHPPPSISQGMVVSSFLTSSSVSDRCQPAHDDGGWLEPNEDERKNHGVITYIVRPTRMRSSIPLLEPGPPRFFWWYENSE
jgi:hypothetical protein